MSAVTRNPAKPSGPDGGPLLRMSRWSSRSSLDRFAVFESATGRAIAEVQGSGVAEVNAAVAAARSSFDRDWRWRTVAERSAMLGEAARVLQQHADELAQLVAVQTGMLLSEALHVDVEECINAFRYFGSTSIALPNGFIDGGSYHDQIYAEPYGVVAALTPTAWPLLYVGAKLAPALVAGNVVVLKPSRGSALAVTRVVELLAPIFPAGVLQLLLGNGDVVGRTLVMHAQVNKVTLAGRTSVGQSVLREAADKIMPLVMQLSTRNVALVFDDADLNLALRAILDGGFCNHGEARTALPRVLVQRHIHDRFVVQLARAVSRMRVGDGADPATHIGPMSSRILQQQALRVIDDACMQGATIAAQALLPSAPEFKHGYFVPPTVLTGVTSSMRVMQQAVFGPIVAVTAFSTVEEAISVANDSSYGLLAAVFSQDPMLISDVSRRLDVGAVYVNNFQRIGYSAMPFTGTKATGYGREERNMETLREYTRQRVVRVPLHVDTAHYWSAVDALLSG